MGGLIMTKDTFFLEATDGVKIAIHRWKSNIEPKAVIQISHGMAEYAMRYDSFAENLVNAGYAVFAADHRGHGETAGSLDKLGYLSDKDGFARVAQDQFELTEEINRQFPKVPVILFAHSFGSFIGQMYIEQHGDKIAGCILSGTMGPNPLKTIAGRMVASLVCMIQGRKKPSPFLTHLTFGANNKRIPNAKSLNSFLSRDEAEVEKYDASPWSGFTCTGGFYQDLMSGLSRIHAPSAISWIPDSLPIFFIAGSEDPVGDYGRSVEKLYTMYKDKGLKRAEIKIYKDARHELLNDICKEEATADILSWIEKVLKG